jgi:hypothetical protein
MGSPTVPVGLERPHRPGLMGATGQGGALPVPEGAVERTDKPDGLVRGTPTTGEASLTAWSVAAQAGARRSGHPSDFVIDSAFGLRHSFVIRISSLTRHVDLCASFPKLKIGAFSRGLSRL